MILRLLIKLKIRRKRITKEEYLTLKEGQTDLAAEIGALKLVTKKGWMKVGIVRDKQQHEEYQTKKAGKSQSFRTMHIFLCLCRGRTREQIENNFEDQAHSNYNHYSVERELDKLCDKYNLETDFDENRRVLTIERHWAKQAVA